MDALPTPTIPVATQPLQFHNIKKESSDEDILEVVNYEFRTPYSSDEYGSVYDHPSEDLSDLALAIRDDTFATRPGVIRRTYSSSSDESITAPDDSDESESLEASPYHGTPTYTSDEYGCVSDHPSEDLSDLAQAVRDESFSPAPLVISRTYSSSDESFGVGEADHFERVIKGSLISHQTISYTDDIQMPVREDRKKHELGEEWKQDMEEDGYASVEDNTDGWAEIGSERKFEATDRVPTSKAQWLFVMAWNGDTSSCEEEDVGDIETIPSDAEIRDVEGLESEGGCGSIHTLESSGESVRNEERKSETLSQEPDAIPTSKGTENTMGPTIPLIGKSVYTVTAADSRPGISDVITSTNIHEGEANPKGTLIAPGQSSVVGRTDPMESGGEERSAETDSEDVSHFQRISDVKPYTRKKRNTLKRVLKRFARCFGGE